MSCGDTPQCAQSLKIPRKILGCDGPGGGPLIWGILDPLGGSPNGISHLAGGSEVNVYSVNPGTSMYLHNPAWESGWIDPYLAYTGSIVKFNVIFERFSRKSRNFDQTD